MHGTRRTDLSTYLSKRTTSSLSTGTPWPRARTASAPRLGMSAACTSWSSTGPRSSAARTPWSAWPRPRHPYIQLVIRWVLGYFVGLKVYRVYPYINNYDRLSSLQNVIASPWRLPNQCLKSLLTKNHTPAF